MYAELTGRVEGLGQVLACLECGAVVASVLTRRHREWHRSIEVLYRRLENRGVAA